MDNGNGHSKTDTAAGKLPRKRRALTSPQAGETTDRQFVTALARELDVLRCFRRDRQALGTAEIARITGLSQPTVWRLCHTLRRLEFLIPTGDRTKLQLGPGALILGQAAAATLPYSEVGRSRMQALADEFQAAVGLAVRDGLEMVLVQRCQSDAPLILNLRTGSRVSIATNTYGWAYLAALEPARRSDLMRKLGAAHQDHWRPLRRTIEEAIALYSERGYLLNCGVFHAEIHSIAVPICDHNGSPLYTINLGGLASVLTPAVLEKEVAPKMLSLAQWLEQALTDKALSPS